MARVTEKLNIIAEELNFLLCENFLRPEDLVISPEGALNALNIKIGYVHYNQSGIAKLYYEKSGLHQLMAKVYNTEPAWA